MHTHAARNSSDGNLIRQLLDAQFLIFLELCSSRLHEYASLFLAVFAAVRDAGGKGHELRAGHLIEQRGTTYIAGISHYCRQRFDVGHSRHHALHPKQTTNIYTDSSLKPKSIKVIESIYLAL